MDMRNETEYLTFLRWKDLECDILSSIYITFAYHPPASHAAYEAAFTCGKFSEPFRLLSPIHGYLAQRNTSILISNVLVGKGSSNFCRTFGCKMPNVPIRVGFPPTVRKIAAA